MIIPFHKYQGTGNDFIIIDNRENYFPDDKNVIRNLCDRKYGIGVDGLMLLEHSELYDFKMRYFNADGKEGTMCGNGGRCLAAFAHRIGIAGDHTKFLAIDGEHEAEILETFKMLAIVNLQMSDVTSVQSFDDHYEINTGSSHYIRFVDEIEKLDVTAQGRSIRNSPAYIDSGINVNFVKQYHDHIFVRTYERGVEDETLSCGTGVVASALATALKTKSEQDKYIVMTKGGKLRVNFSKNDNGFKDVWLEGPATYVFKGEIEI
ncbi:MAG: diaminopimelate epimerase [Bacteroidales bacterium]|nr:diaminopimelate epimerase [Bacteroidales bacterium]